ncbi:hypothetical protein HANVADRAFT_2103 [Hanseniaspora valbyensis NRRL Y-1626]|uniref:Peptide hydrolase n=1 Tax=Hanseniaspora valbyensis NRRL Y-1626 TaxID=766949 RepID=A0A1B7TE54_9ASCO|nr:hypothetical protein HANVADRAFT_2103 [Hanseniaspora valbyensis NRRL Y-1626]
MLCFNVFFFNLYIVVINASSLLNIDDFLNLNPNSTTSLLTLFNMTRCVETENSKLTLNIITDFYKNMPIKWRVQKHTFYDSGYEFNNLIVTLPHYNEYDYEDTVFQFPKCNAIGLANDLILAVHYDTIANIPSFVGAIDSAASIAILLFISLQISEDSNELRRKNLKIIFFDGEEAFGKWSESDSLYGSRELAKIYNENGLINKIDLLVLLDLLGGVQSRDSKSHTIFNYFPETTDYYKQLLSIENDIYQSTQISLLDPQMSNVNIMISDDHVPFRKLGVKCVHLIPLPFPAFWHTIDDDFEHLDINIIKHISSVLLKFSKKFVAFKKIYI